VPQVARGEGVPPLRVVGILPAMRGQDVLATEEQGQDALATAGVLHTTHRTRVSSE
jgi:hypothetical protein